MKMTFPILSAIVFLPSIAALLICFINKRRSEFIKYIVVAITLIVFGLSILLFAGFDKSAGLQFEESHDWIPQFHIRYYVGIDGLSLLLIVLTAFLTPIAVLCSWKKISDKGFYVSLLTLETGMLGVFCARDLFLFYVFWEAMLIPMYLIIGVWGGRDRIYAAVKFIIYTMVGSLVMLVAILYLYFVSGYSFDISDLQRTGSHLPPHIPNWLFLAFALSFAIKVPLFPLHTWLPDAHVEAPTAGSVILEGVLLKMGVYGFLRFAIPFFPKAAIHFAPLFGGLAIVGIIFGALMAMVQSDIKKLIAYSSVSHLGLVMLGAFSFTGVGIQGCVYQMLSHGISTGGLFLLVGVLYDRTHKRGVNDFGGLAKVTPLYAAIFMIVTLSSIGLPGLNGFVGEFLILSGAFSVNKIVTAVAGTGIILGAVYMLRLYRDTMFGKVTAGKNEDIQDINKLELGYFIPLIIVIFFMGILPNIFLDRINMFANEFIGFLK